MARTHPFPVPYADLRRPGGPGLVVPLVLPAPFGVGRSLAAVASDLAIAIDAGWLEDGDHLELVAARLDETEALRLRVELPEVDVLRPAQSLEVPLVVGRIRSGFQAIVPGLAVQAWGADRDAAIAGARTTLLAHLARDDRRERPERLVELAWFGALELHVVDHAFTWLTFEERRERVHERERGKGLLKDCARPLASARAVELEDVRAELRRALTARAEGGVVLVGPQGSGKTTLVADEAHAAGGAFGHAVWTTSAARLENALTRGGSWQPNVARLCAELEREGLWLHVARLADLFEVGRYEGNDTSIGEYLRPWLARGELRLVTEATPEELAAVELRWPGIAESLARVEIPAPDDARLERVVTAWIRARGGLLLEAGDEAIRLQRRFSPYSGFPGRTLRFLDALARDTVPPVTRDAVTARFCEETGIARAFVDPEVRLPVDELRARIEGALFGQPEAVAALLDVVVAIRADVAPRGRPIASLAFTGPTGVGKTEAARVLAEVLFGARDRIVRFDLSEFSTAGAVLGLTSSPDPHGEGLLTGAVRRQPFAVVLLDEVEKGHPDFFDLLLQVLGEGRLSDHRGRVADFCSAVVVMTSNLGAELAGRTRPGLGVVPADAASDLVDAFRRALRPELYNRLDRIVPFGALPPDATLRVLDRELAALSRDRALTGRRATFVVTSAARQRLAALGHDPARGARPLQRALRERVLGPMAVALDAAPRAPSPRFSVDEVGGGIAVALVASGEAVAGPTAFLDEVTAVRRALQAVVGGDTFAEHAAAGHLLLREARTMADERRGQVVDVGRLHTIGAPLEALRTCLEEALVLETGAAEDRDALALVEEAREAAERRLFAAVHPAWDTALCALWAPGDAPADELLAWTDDLVAHADALGIAVERRHVWLDRRLVSVRAEEPRPPGASKWAGIEVWLEGPCAAVLVEGRGGLYVVPRGPRRAEEQRVLVRVATPVLPQVPSCCAGTFLGEAALRPGGGAGRRDAPAVRFVVPRPENVLLRSTYDGRPAPWPPPAADRERFLVALRAHLAGRTA